MYLKSVTIQGFKSFPDKVSVNFIDGLTAIVGPNGSGKSNICDAIRWVLGEQSTKTLRGAKMEDVIFNGTARRAATGYAEVTLVLNNETRIIHSDYDEIAVTRRYYRSGESEYYINKKSVRLKDIHEMFMDTGLGRDGYSIIGQGRIAEILSLKSEDRRQVFEEAAGISKFRYRKNESERKLTQAQDNLERVGDIIMQLEERIGPLQAASEKARRYLDLRERMKGLEIGLWLRQITQARAEEQRLQEALNISESTLELSGKNCEQLDYQIEKGYEDMKSCEVEIDRQKNKAFAAQQEMTQNDGAIQLKQTRIQAAEESISRLQLEIEYSRISGQELEQKIEDAQQELQQAQQEREDLQQQLQQHMEQDDVLTRYLDAKHEEMEALDQKLKADMARRADCRISLSAKNVQIITATDRLKEIAVEIEQLTEKQVEGKQAASDAAQELQRMQEVCQQNQNTIAGYEKLTAIKGEEVQKLLDQYQQLDRELYQKRSRYKMLKDMEREYEGYGRSVKMVMKEAEHGRIHGIHGPVSSLLHTEASYVTAIEVALGGSAQHIVVEDEESGKQAIALLKRQSGGRATFLPLTSVKGKDFSWSGVETHHGYVGIASRLVQYEPKYEGIIRSLLGRTVVVQDMDTGIAMARAYRYAFRIVTLDGQVLNAGGSMTGGSLGKTTSVFSRGAELEQLTWEITRLQQQTEELKSRGQAARETLSQAQYDLQKAQGQQNEQNQQRMELEYQTKALQDALVQVEEKLDALHKEQETLHTQQQTYRQESSALETEIHALEQAIAESERQTVAIEENRARFVQERENLNALIFDLKIDMNTRDKDIEMHTANIESFRQQITAGTGDQQRKEQEIDAKQQEIQTGQNEISRLEGENRRLTAQSERSRAEVERYTQLRMQTEQAVSQRQKEVKEERARLASMQREHDRLQSQLETAAGTRDTLVDRMWETYEMTLSEALSYTQPAEDANETAKQAAELKGQIKALGNINLDAIEEYKEVREKYDFLTAQREDLVQAQQGLEQVITDLTANMRRIFREQFEIIGKQFQQTFRQMFGGGSGELILEDPEHVLECGIEIRVQPPGKKVKSLTLLSGGEQAFVAIALIFAILKVRPTPFCVFDEIEAALDDVNVRRYAQYLRENDQGTQFIVVTHRRGTMEAADMLYGVTMQEQGVSKLLAIHVSEVEEKLHLKAK